MTDHRDFVVVFLKGSPNFPRSSALLYGKRRNPILSLYNWYHRFAGQLPASNGVHRVDAASPAFQLTTVGSAYSLPPHTSRRRRRESGHIFGRKVRTRSIGDVYFLPEIAFNLFLLKLFLFFIKYTSPVCAGWEPMSRPSEENVLL